MNNEVYICEIGFSITGLLRFVSHLEMQNFFCKLVIRSELPVKFSSGFNPHPKVSLPVPRSVGIESYNDRARVELTEFANVECVRDRIIRYVPSEMIVEKVWLTERRLLEVPVAIDWRIHLAGTDVENDFVDGVIDEIVRREKLFIDRGSKKKKNSKQIDVKKMIESISRKEDEIYVRVKMSSYGTLKPIEILQVLGLEDRIGLKNIVRSGIRWAVKEHS